MITKEVEKSIQHIENIMDDAVWELKDLRDKLDLLDEVISFLLDLSHREDCPEDVTVQANDLFMRI